VQPSVWTVSHHDRIGEEYKRDELEPAQWMLFVAHPIVNNETTESLEFRNKRLEMGFHGCWLTVHIRIGGSAADLMEEGEDARKFLAAEGIAC